MALQWPQITLNHDDGDFSEYQAAAATTNGALRTIEAEAAYAGSAFGYKCAFPSGLGNAHCVLAQYAPTIEYSCSFRGYINLTGCTPQAGMNLKLFYTYQGGANSFQLRLMELDGGFGISVTNRNQSDPDPVAIPSTGWVLIQGQIYYLGASSVQVNGVEVLTFTGTSRGWNAGYFGCVPIAGTVDNGSYYYLDQWQINSDSNDVIEPIAVAGGSPLRFFT